MCNCVTIKKTGVTFVTGGFNGFGIKTHKTRTFTNLIEASKMRSQPGSAILTGFPGFLCRHIIIYIYGFGGFSGLGQITIFLPLKSILGVLENASNLDMIIDSVVAILIGNNNMLDVEKSASALKSIIHLLSDHPLINPTCLKTHVCL